MRQGLVMVWSAIVRCNLDGALTAGRPQMRRKAKFFLCKSNHAARVSGDNRESTRCVFVEGEALLLGERSGSGKVLADRVEGVEIQSA